MRFERFKMTVESQQKEDSVAGS